MGAHGARQVASLELIVEVVMVMASLGGVQVACPRFYTPRGSRKASVEGVQLARSLELIVQVACSLELIVEVVMVMAFLGGVPVACPRLTPPRGYRKASMEGIQPARWHSVPSWGCCRSR